MEKKIRVLADNNFPVRCPIWKTITCWLALEHLNAPQWIYGAVGLLNLFLWVTYIRVKRYEESVDILNDGNQRYGH